MGQLSTNHTYLYNFTERQVDGDSFIQLTREDFSLLFPENDKFLVGSKLYRIAKAQKAIAAKQDMCRDTESLLGDLSAVEGEASCLLQSKHPSRASTPASGVLTPSNKSLSNISVPSSSRYSDQPPRKKRCVEATDADIRFKLPVFSPTIRQCIKKDAFYTSTQRNCLIKEACTSLRSYCWEKEESVTNLDKRELARSLCELAPKSLGDSENCKPEVK